MPPLGMSVNFVSSYTTTEISKQKVISGKDELPPQKVKVYSVIYYLLN
jgi:hypothetical protein